MHKGYKKYGASCRRSCGRYNRDADAFGQLALCQSNGCSLQCFSRNNQPYIPIYSTASSSADVVLCRCCTAFAISLFFDGLLGTTTCLLPSLIEISKFSNDVRKFCAISLHNHCVIPFQWCNLRSAMYILCCARISWCRCHLSCDKII